MNGLEFVSSVLGTVISWPVAVIAIVLIFRKPLTKLLSRLKRGKIGPGEFEFDEELEAAERNSQSAKLSLEDAAEDPTTQAAPARHDSTAQVVQAWEQLTAQMRARWQQEGLGNTGPGRPPLARRMAHDLAEAGYVDQAFVDSVSSLQEVRNAVVHGRVPTAADAQKFERASLTLVQALGTAG